MELPAVSDGPENGTAGASGSPEGLRGPFPTDGRFRIALTRRRESRAPAAICRILRAVLVFRSSCGSQNPSPSTPLLSSLSLSLARAHFFCPIQSAQLHFLHGSSIGSVNQMSRPPTFPCRLSKRNCLSSGFQLRPGSHPVIPTTFSSRAERPILASRVKTNNNASPSNC